MKQLSFTPTEKVITTTGYKVRWSYRKAKNCAQRIYRLKLARLDRLCKRAGLPDHTFLHNAMVGYHYNRPWQGVDYDLARKADYISRHLFDANRIVDRYVRRRDQENPRWIQPRQGDFA
jgi:hypothetical protein